MDWIFDHMQLVIAAAAAFAYWLNARKQSQAEAEEERPEVTFQDDSREAAEEAERARRIREEIRRKISERSAGGPPPLTPPPMRSEPPPPRFEPVVDTGMLDQQRRLQQQLEEVVRTKQRAEALRQGMPELPKSAPTVRRRTAPVGSLRADLRDGRSLRRAVILREVLGLPVGLR